MFFIFYLVQFLVLYNGNTYCKVLTQEIMFQDTLLLHDIDVIVHASFQIPQIQNIYSTNLRCNEKRAHF
jgi:hypothetical protein